MQLIPDQIKCPFESLYSGPDLAMCFIVWVYDPNIPFKYVKYTVSEKVVLLILLALLTNMKFLSERKSYENAQLILN